MARPGKRSAPARKIHDPAALKDIIRRRAYELYEKGGREHGHETGYRPRRRSSAQREKQPPPNSAAGIKNDQSRAPCAGILTHWRVTPLTYKSDVLM
jgi:hypothetical protein